MTQLFFLEELKVIISKIREINRFALVEFCHASCVMSRILHDICREYCITTLSAYGVSSEYWTNTV